MPAGKSTVQLNADPVVGELSVMFVVAPEHIDSIAGVARVTGEGFTVIVYSTDAPVQGMPKFDSGSIV
jgi:hypothetical protein